MPSGVHTSFQLLTRDGAVSVSFSTKLSASQYDTLYECVSDCGTRGELREHIAMLANEWGITAIVDDG
jgi:hypothetical protein